MTKLEHIISVLEDLGWRRYLDDDYHWKYLNTNRYVDSDGVYIDFYCYADEKKYKGYLTLNEFTIFEELFKCLYCA